MYKAFQRGGLDMNVATALNRKYLLYTGVMLSSLCKNNPTHIDAYLLHSELTDEDVAYLQNGLSEYDITIHSLKIEREKFSSRLGTSSMWTIETYYRLMLLDILPIEVERLLYLDVDIIVNKSIEEMYHMDFGNSEIIACENDLGANDMANYGPMHQRMFGTPEMKDYRYFNAGVLLLNIASLRRKYNFQYYMDVAQNDWNFQMEAFDQDLLNYVHWKHIKYIPFEWYNLFARSAYYQNVHYDIVKEKVAIIHFTGYKPWDGTESHFDTEELWWDYAKETPFYDEISRQFIRQAMMENDAEDRFKKVAEENLQLRSNVDSLLQINEKMKAIVNQYLGK